MSKNAKKNIEAIYPLSPLQRGLLFHVLFDRQSESYIQQAAYALHGDLDVGTLRLAWQRVIDRHSALRTGFFGEQREEPIQVVQKRAKLKFVELDWRREPAAAGEDHLQELLSKDRLEGFGLKHPPLLRFHLIRTGDASYWFVMSFPHLLLDGWSVALLMREVFAFYQHPDLEIETPPPYRDYIAWLRAQDRSRAEEFWRRTLKGFTSPTRIGTLPTDLEESSGGEAHFDQIRVELDESLTATLGSVARRHRLTVNTVVQGAFALLLSRYIGDDDLVFGVTVAGRPDDLPGSGEMVGLFMNTLAPRIHIPGSGSTSAWLRELQEQQVEMRSFESSSLTDIQGWSDVPRRLPLFEILYSFENYPVSTDAASPDLGFELGEVRSFERTHYPLTLQVLQHARLTLVLTYDLDRLERVVAMRMLRHFEQLLGALAENLDRPLPELKLLTPDQRHALLVEANDTAAPLVAPGTVYELFSDQAQRSPRATAAVCQGERVTYRELEGRAASFAATIAADAGPETTVALFADRSIDFLAAILGAFRAGTAYLPLDPHHPPLRLAQVLARSASPLVLTTSALQPVLDRALNRLEPSRRPRVLLFEQLSEGAVEPVPTAPAQLAYVIYTSGSTGAPKGAMVEHRGLINHLNAKILDLDLDSTDIVAQTASQCFDISVWQFLAPLLIGGRVHIFPDEVAHDPDLLLDHVAAAEVTILETVPSLLRILLEQVDRQQTSPRLLTLRWLIPTGEALPPRLCRRWRRHFPDIPLLNAYGPTECSDDVTHHPVVADLDVSIPRVPIGKPLINTRLYVAAQDLQLVPPGVAGELYIGGHGVGRGYLKEPAKTAAVFVPDPFGAKPGNRLYKSGDRAAWIPGAGAIDFLGRLDTQVKIRGFRIELEEIRHALLGHPAVSEAVAVLGRNPAGGDELWSYYVASGDLGASELKTFLAASLPEYMIPTRCVGLAELPLNANGKIDVAALPPPGDSDDLRSRHVPPRTETEKRIAAIWTDVLGCDSIGVDDNFFNLGGHSLNATRAIARLSEAFEMKLSVRMLFLRPVLGDLAASLDKARSAMESEESVDARIMELRERIRKMQRAAVPQA